ncbi:Cof-type HAD-IIB family hydrolase [Vibrio sp. ZSDZ65]|uniref:Cof-type HAD-IIB family hydrolase n=1 Tax=Vibrio qingdaonensis TaxID=2829491 RepID=A0A9X3CQE8_9VIBR|nr:Cof-type HAD-IIB family hydrolase [Vibrio qingdaonensis]MCW8346695.1 Cof-type HAD-IIB family hydrolase [Vibrio qingdaonensis]
MPTNEIKFIASDMDGTLLNPQGKLDTDFFNLHRQLNDNGIIFCAASGRQYYSLLETFAPIQDQMMFIAENGTLVMHQGKELYSCEIEKHAIHRIISEVRKIPNAHIVLCGKRTAYIETQDEQALEEMAKYYHRRESVSDLLSVEDDFIKVAICHFDGTEQHVYPAINQEFGHDHQVVVSAKIWLDVMNVEASKGTAIRHLQKTLGFTHEQTMSFGDYFNDVEMLQASYHSYAVDNAHEKVKTFAKFNAPSNAEQGVQQVISAYLATLK